MPVACRSHANDWPWMARLDNPRDGEDWRVASSEVRHACTPKLRQTYSHESWNNNNIFFSPFFCLSKRKGRKKRTPRTFVALIARYRAYLIRFVVAQNRHPWLTSLNWLQANWPQTHGDMRANVKGGEEKAVFLCAWSQLRGKLVFIVRMAFTRSNDELFRIRWTCCVLWGECFVIPRLYRGIQMI